MTRFASCFLLVCLLMLCQQKAMAQKEAASGFIVTNLNDTIRGTLLDKDWNISPQTIKFKAGSEADYKTYSAKDIKAFSVDGIALYISTVILLDVSSIEVDRLLMEGSAPDTITIQLFMKELVRGKISLYYHKDANAKKHFFIQKNDSAFAELISRKYRSKANKIVLYEKFRGQLAFFINECSSLNEKIKQVSFSEDGLSNLVIAYNKCLNQPSQISLVKTKSARFKVALAAGFFISDIAFEGYADAYGIKEASFSPWSNFTGGVSFIFYLQKRFQRHHLVNEFLWKDLKFNSTVDKTQVVFGLPITYHNTYNIDISYLRWNIIYRYHFLSKEKIKLFFDIGFTNSLALDIEASLHQVEEYQGNNYEKEVTIFERKHEEGFIVSAGGYYLDKWGIKLAYERSNGMSDYSYLKSTVNSFYIFVNYLISKRQ